MSLLFTIFALVFVTQLISWIGQSVLLELVYAVHLRVFHAATAAKQRKLKSDILVLKSELLRTSAQDQFAKWAKLRRSVDKALADLEKLNGEISARKSAFALRFHSVIWVLTTGLQFAVGWWYRKAAVFYLPPGWFGPLGWWLALPFAPTGSVSVGMWQMACKRVLKVGERVVKELSAVRVAEAEAETKEKEEPAGAPAN
ncbi:CHD5-like protein-domain-containing protein [Mycena maculata]|uniref:CHD5-like protein-domain-containing protein n=1 Tax=Mycena maculata TaxID=230809 RepID=A0AAD7IMD0_9AGAR|nr:CHD5-like protein-domain-containing protein [Mycena maculata]